MEKSPALTSPLLNLHIELQLQIVQYLRDSSTAQNALYNWSSVSSYFRNLLAPFLFSSIILRNTEKSGNSVNLIAQSKYCEYVRHFSFEGTAPGDAEEGFSDVDIIFPQVVENVLTNLGRFSNLEIVRIHFPMGFEAGWEAPWQLFQDPESVDDRQNVETHEAWRALNTKVYAALARNVDPGFKSLELDNLIPAEASSFSSVAFQSLLGKLSHFRLSSWDTSGFFRGNRLFGYVDYTSKFDRLFFNHLSAVTHIDISASDLPMEIFGNSDTSLDRNLTQMPLLRSLHLDSIFIDRKLRAFLTSHAQTLEIVKLLNCHAKPPNRNPDGIYWWDLFATLSRAKPRMLSEFQVHSANNNKFELFDEFHSTQEVKNEAALALESLKSHPEKRLFSYANIDDKYGHVVDCEEDNLLSFQEGTDQRAYDDLIRIVEANKRRHPKQ